MKPGQMHHDHLLQVGKRALLSGGQAVALASVEWDAYGSGPNACTQPVLRSLTGREDVETSKGIYGPGHGKVAFVDILVRCRRCAACLKARRNLWYWRARHETELAPRTWFGTMTLSPEAQYRALLIAERDTPGWSTLDDQARYKARVGVIYADIQKWLKRVRFESKAKLRYLIVAEKHQSGDPHFHGLFHETSPSGTVGERVWRGQWSLGHSQFTLVDKASPKGIGYACKYLAKETTVAPRASLRYGTLVGGS